MSKRSGVKSAPKNITNKPTFTCDSLLDKAEECVSNLQYDLAQKFCERALTADGNSTRGLEIMATILLEQDDPENAHPLLEKAVSLEPDTGFRKYMMLAMLYPGTQSLAFYEKGVSVLKFDMSTALPTPVAGDDWSISLASAYTSIAELYMTDLCMEAKAESECKRVLQLAVEADPENIEALQTFASYYISACDKDQARQAIAKSVSLWLKVEEIEKLKAGGLTEEEAIGGMDTESLPSYEFRINTARILSELEMYKEALLVLSRLEKEDDEVVEVWYMHGIVAQLIQDHTTAIECLREAEKLFVKTGCPDHEVLSHIKSILETYEKEGLINSDGSLNADAGEDMSE